MKFFTIDLLNVRDYPIVRGVGSPHIPLHWRKIAYMAGAARFPLSVAARQADRSKFPGLGLFRYFSLTYRNRG